MCLTFAHGCIYYQQQNLRSLLFQHIKDLQPKTSISSKITKIVMIQFSLFLPNYQIAYFIELCRNDIFQIGLDNTRYYQWLIHLIVKENTSNMRAKISFSGKFNYLESHLLVQKVMLLIIYSLYFGTESLPLHQHQAQMKPTLFNVRAAHK